MIIGHKEISSSLSNEQLKSEIARLEQEVTFCLNPLQNGTMRERLDAYEKGGVKMISEEEINEARKDVVKHGNEWKKRKRACMDM